MDQEKKKVQDLQGIANNKCFIGLCPPIKSRHRLSRRAEEGATTFQELINQAGQLSTPVGYWNVPEDIEDDKPPKDFEVFESRQKLFNDILKALEDATISMIGVHGMGGVGKSTLLEEVVRKVKKAKLFDQVVMVTVTENPDILNIQDQIAELLGLELKEKTAKARALRLQRRFKGEKEDEEKEKVEKQKEERFLLILDDLWAKLNFTDVGIPFEVEQKRCKILLASRSKGVLLEFDEMHDQNTFHIALLDDKEEVGEAWHLFKKKVRSISPELETLGNKIAKRCGGLPLAISAVAQSLRNKSRFAWENALKELEKPSSGGLKDISSAVYTALKLSYNHIEGEEAKRFFLFCSLLSHNTLIEDLLTYTIGLGLLPDDDDYTVEQARNKVLTWIENLKASGLLLDSYSNDRFNMHDILCDVAKSIASEEKNGMLPLKQEDVLKSWPEVKAMKERNWINLRLASNTMLPDEVHCPELTFLHILGEDPSIKVSPHPSKNDCSTKVPPYFFNKVEMLKVLDLTRMDLSSFPSSLGLLSSLQTLCLHNSVLGDIALVGEIRTLKILSLRDSDIERLPEEIGQLVQLRLLNLTSCTQLRTIPAGIFSKLTKLEELYMRESFSEWKAEGDASRQSNASFDELSSLSLLTTLEVHIPNAKMVNGDFSFFKELKRYKIYIGREGRFNWFHGYEYSMTLQHSRALQLINVNVSINDLHHEIKMLLGKSEYLYLDRLEGITIALDELKDGEGFSNLKKLHIKNWSGIQYIIGDERNEFQELRSDGKGSTSNTQHQCLPLLGQKMVFPCLEELYISYINVERIWDDKLSDCNQKLTRLIIKGCDKLKHLLSTSMARSMVHLNYLKVQNCDSLREIISSVEGNVAEGGVAKDDTMTQIFPKLESLVLSTLRDLERFCHGNQFEFSSLKTLRIWGCFSLKTFISDTMVESETHGQEAEEKSEIYFSRLFNEKVVFPCLEELDISYINVERIWDDKLSDCNQKLTSLSIWRCDKLKHLLSTSMARSLVHLNYLKVHGCKSLREIISTEGNVAEAVAKDYMMTQIFPKLESLVLNHLPKLKRFCCGNQFKFSSLKTLIIWECPSFTTFVTDHVGEEVEENKSRINFSPLFNEKVVLPMVEDLRIRGFWEYGMINKL